MSKLENKHLERVAAMQALTDFSWHSWNSPIGLSIGLIGLVISLNGLALFAILMKFLFLMK